MDNRSFEKFAKFRYIGMRVTDKKLIHEGNKDKFNPDNACYHAVTKLLSSRLLPKKYKLK
jgi:hypothetical protein